MEMSYTEDFPNKEATYHSRFSTGKKTWREAQEIKAVFELEIDGETRVFRGILPMTGVIRNGQ